MKLHPGTWPRRLVLRRWLLAFVPVNAATSGFGVSLPLLILLRLGGTLLDVALAAVLFNVAVILASILWGYLADRVPRRRLFLLINFGGFAVVYALLAWAPSLPLLYVLYTFVGLIAPAGASAANLLILEQFSEEERPGAFASFQEMSILGAIGGVLAGYLWLVQGGALVPLLWLFAALAVASTVIVAIEVPRSDRPLTTRHVMRYAESLASRLRHSVALRAYIPFFSHPWSLRPDGRRPAVGRWLREELRHELPLILGAVFLFNFAANLFNTSYTPYLESIGLTGAAIFLVNCSNNIAQGFSFPASGWLARREGSARLVQQSSYLRAVGYLAVAGFTFVPLLGADAFAGNAIAFAVMGGAIALFSTASSLLLFRSLRGREAGALLGWNSAFGGIAAVLGALLSGIVSYFGSYRLTFLLSAGALLASLPVWAAAELAFDRRRAALRSSPAVPAPSGT
jgi:MFS family permease